MSDSATVRSAIATLAKARRELLVLEGTGSKKSREVVKTIDGHLAALNLQLVALEEAAGEPGQEQYIGGGGGQMMPPLDTRSGPAIPVEVWPQGCRAVVHCSRVRACTYYECPHAGRGAWLGGDIDRAREMGLLEPTGEVKTDLMGR